MEKIQDNSISSGINMNQNISQLQGSNNQIFNQVNQSQQQQASIFNQSQKSQQLPNLFGVSQSQQNQPPQKDNNQINQQNIFTQINIANKEQQNLVRQNPGKSEEEQQGNKKIFQKDNQQKIINNINDLKQEENKTNTNLLQDQSLDIQKKNNLIFNNQSQGILFQNQNNQTSQQNNLINNQPAVQQAQIAPFKLQNENYSLQTAKPNNQEQSQDSQQQNQQLKPLNPIFQQQEASRVPESKQEEQKSQNNLLNQNQSINFLQQTNKLDSKEEQKSQNNIYQQPKQNDNFAQNINQQKNLIFQNPKLTDKVDNQQANLNSNNLFSQQQPEQIKLNDQPIQTNANQQNPQQQSYSDQQKPTNIKAKIQKQNLSKEDYDKQKNQEYIFKTIQKIIRLQRWEDLHFILKNNELKQDLIQNLKLGIRLYSNSHQLEQKWEIEKFNLNWFCPCFNFNLTENGQIRLLDFCLCISKYSNINPFAMKTIMDGYLSKIQGSQLIKQFVQLLNKEEYSKKFNSMFQYISENIVEQNSYKIGVDFLSSFSLLSLIRSELFQEYLIQRNVIFEFLKFLTNYVIENKLDDRNIVYEFLYEIHKDLIIGLQQQYDSLIQYDIPHNLTNKDSQCLALQSLQEQKLILEIQIVAIDFFRIQFGQQEVIKILTNLKNQSFQGNWLYLKQKNPQLSIKNEIQFQIQNIINELEQLSFYYYILLLNLIGLNYKSQIKQPDNTYFKLMNSKNENELNLIQEDNKSIQNSKFMCLLTTLTSILQKNNLITRNFDDIHILQILFNKQTNILMHNQFVQKTLTIILHEIAQIILYSIPYQQNDERSQSDIQILSKIIIFCIKKNKELNTQYYNELEVYIDNSIQLENNQLIKYIDLYPLKYKFFKVLIKNNSHIQGPLVINLLEKYQFNFWNNEIFEDWVIQIRQIQQQANNQLYFQEVDEQYKYHFYAKIKFVCDTIISNPFHIQFLNKLMIGEERCQNDSCLNLIILIVDTYYYLSKQNNIPFKVLNRIIKCLQILIHTKNYQNQVMNILQLYPQITLENDNNENHPILHIFFNHQKNVNFLNGQKSLVFQKRLLQFLKTILQEFESPFYSLINFQQNTNSQIDGVSQFIELQSKRYYTQDLQQIYQIINETEIYGSLLNKSLEIPIFSNLIDNLIFYTFNIIDKTFDNIQYNLIEDKYGKSIKFEIGFELFQITDILLQKLIINPERIPLCDYIPLYGKLTEIEKYIGQHLNQSLIKDQLLNLFRIINIATDSGRQKEFIDLRNYHTTFYGLKVKKMFLSGISLIETIINVIDSLINNQNQQKFQISEIQILQTFYEIFLDKNNNFSYCIETVDLFNKQQIKFKFNFIQAISANIQLESRDENYYHNFQQFYLHYTQQELNLLNNKEFVYYESNLHNFNYIHLSSLILKKQRQNGFGIESITSGCLRLINKLMLLWEDYNSKYRTRINLFQQLTYISLGDIDFLGIQRIDNNSYMKLVENLLRIHIGNILLYTSHENEINSVLEFLILVINSQPQVANLLFKKNQLGISIQPYHQILDSIEKWFSLQSGLEKNKISFYQKQFSSVRITNKYLNLIQQIFQKQKFYPHFTQQIKQMTKLNIFLCIAKTIFKEYEECQNIYQASLQNFEIEKQNILINYRNTNKDLQILIRKMVIESIMDCKIITTDSLRIFTNLICFEFQIQDIQMKIPISETLIYIFDMFITSIQSINTLHSYEDYCNKSLQELTEFLNEQQKQIIYLNTISEKNVRQSFTDNFDKTKQVKKQNMSLNKFYMILDCNFYGYGRDYLFDTNELILGLLMMKINPIYTDRLILLVHSQNINASYLKCKQQLLKSFQKLFCLVCTVSNENIGMSINFKDNYQIGSDEAQDNNLVNTIFPNNHLKFACNFYTIFFSQKQNQDKQEQVFQKIRLISEQFIKGIIEQTEYESLALMDSRLEIINSSFQVLIHLIEDYQQEKQQSGGFKIPFENQEQTIQWNIFFQKLLYSMLETSYTDRTIVIQVLKQALQCTYNSLQLIHIYQKNENFPLDLIFEGNQNLILIIKRIIEISQGDEIPVAVDSLNILLKINPQQFLKYLNIYKDLVDLLNNKLLKYDYYSNSDLQKNDKMQLNLIYSSISKFFISLCWTSNNNKQIGAQILQQSNFLSCINMNQKLKQIQSPYIQNPEGLIIRDSTHILWCWTISILKNLILNIKKDDIQFKQIVKFLEIKEFNLRIISILQMPIYLQENKDQLNQSLNQYYVTQQCMKFSIAYLQELQIILQLLAALYSDSFNFRLQSEFLYEQYLNVLSRDTLQLFHLDRSFSLSDYLPETDLEKKLFTIKHISSKNKISTDNGYIKKSSLLSKSRNYQTNSLPDSFNQNQYDQSEQCSLFEHLIQSYMFNIMNSAFLSLECAFENSKYSELMVQNVLQNSSQTQNKKIFEWNYSHWNHFGKLLQLCQKFLSHCIILFIIDDIQNTNTGLLNKINMINSSFEFSLDQGNINQLQDIVDYDEFLTDILISWFQLFQSSIFHLKKWNDWKCKYQQLMNNDIEHCKRIYDKNLVHTWDKIQIFYKEKRNQINQELVVSLPKYNYIMLGGGKSSLFEYLLQSLQKYNQN